MAKKRRRRGKGPGTVYRRGQLWSIAWVSAAKAVEGVLGVQDHLFVKPARR
jgi:hypothetical protein